MQSEFSNSSLSTDDDHYVAFLSNGINSHSSQRQIYNKKGASRLGSRLLKFTAFIIGSAVIGATVLLFFSIQKTTNNKASLISPYASHFVADAIFNQSFYRYSFEDFIAQHGKKYSTMEEKTQRSEIFAKNLMFIHLHNSQNFSYTLAPNAFTDLTFDEFKDLHFTGYRKRNEGLRASRETDWELLSNPSIPEAVNWKDQGCVSFVRDQRKCGSCWAFSAAGAVEGAFCAKHGKLVNLSEQQMVDCAGPEGNEGCDGGEMDDAFQYIIDHGGLCTEESYPYTAREGRCRDNECHEAIEVVQFADVPRKSEEALAAAVAFKGPVSIAIQADQMPFQFYHSGIFDSSCGTNLNHGVLVVGYGRDSETEQDYWLVKNSWGPNWGEGGFIKLVRNDGSRSGKCGMLLDASYPIVA